MPSTEWVHNLKVVDLKEECKKRGLPVGGKKAELVERLEEWIAENEKSPEGKAAPGEPAGEAGEEEQAADQDEQPAAEEDKQQVAAAEAKEDKEEQPEAAAVEEAPAQKSPAVEAPAPAAEEPAAEQEAAAVPEEAAAAPMEADDAAAAPAEAAAAGDAEQLPSAGKAGAAPEQQPPAATHGQPEPAAPEPQQPAVAADVDLDYGEDSDDEGAAAAAHQQPHQGKPAEEGAKRKREEEQPAAAARRVSGSRGPSADKALAAAASQGSAERPSKVLRSSSGFSLSNAEKGAAPAPEDIPEAAEPATRALRIDGFVRPFTERQVRELLSETGQVLALWMPSIKTHAYCVFETKAQAEATRRATYQLQWPATNPKRLAPRFVPLSEAETAIGTGAGNPDFRLKRTEEDGEEAAAAAAPAAAAGKSASEGSKEAAAPVVDRSKREWNRNRRSPSPPLEGVRDLREMLSRKPSGGRSADGPAAAAAAAGPSRGGSEREAATLPPGLGRPAERRASEPERLGSRGREEHPVRTLDELFRKTSAKPCIYWLPLTDEQVAEKKRTAAAAAEQAKQPAANGSAEKK